MWYFMPITVPSKYMDDRLKLKVCCLETSGFGIEVGKEKENKIGIRYL